MTEYLIRRTDGEWFDLHGRLEEAFRPSSFVFEPIESAGGERIRVSGVEISFAYEDPGIHVCIGGELAEEVADKIVEEIRQNIERVSGQTGRVVPL